MADLIRISRFWILGSFAILFAQQARLLTPGTPVESSLAAGQINTHSVAVDAGQYLHIRIDARSGSLRARLVAPDGASVAIDDGTVLSLRYVTSQAAVLQVEVRLLGSSSVPSRYAITVSKLRSAIPDDDLRLQAVGEVQRAQQLQAGSAEEQHRQATVAYETALDLWRRTGEREAEIDTLSAMCAASRALDALQPLVCYGRLLTLARGREDRAHEAVALTRIGLIHMSDGGYGEALEAFRQALAATRALGHQHDEAILLSDIAMAYLVLREPQRAIDYYLQELPIWRKIGERNLEATTRLAIGAACEMSERPERGLSHYLQALGLYRALTDRRGAALALHHIGLLYFRIHQPAQGRTYSRQALAAWLDIGKPSAVDRSFIAQLYRHLDQPQEAIAGYEQAAAEWRKIGANAAAAGALTEIAAIQLGLPEWDAAMWNAREALALLDGMAQPVRRAKALYVLARAERTSGELTAALAHVRAALDIEESLRGTVAGPESRTSYSAGMREKYEFQISLLMELYRRTGNEGELADALYTSERARARSLMETLAEIHADIRQDADPALLDEERRLTAALDAQASRQAQLLAGRHTVAQAAEIEQEIRALETAYEETETRLRQRNPRYAALMRPQPLALAEIRQQVLERDTLLLEYSLGEDRSFLWAVTLDQITAYELPGRRAIEAAARKVHQQMAVPPGDTPPAQDASRVLARMLLHPVAAQLGSRRLLISTEGGLQYVSFAALPDPRTPRAPLVQTNQIVYLPSASTLATMRREMAGREPATKTLAVIADPVFSAQDPRVRQPAVRPVSGKVESFPRLWATRVEAGQIAAIAGGKSWTALDFDASRAMVTGGTLGSYRILHFATHGLLNEEHPQLSGLVFSLVDRSGRPQDGFLRAHQVYHLRLKADLAVLSTCQSALGKQIRGEGIVGLTRGFMYAGAARVVASLWRVPDAATAQLMRYFYAGMLQQGLSPAAALRAAQVKIARQPNWSSPYYWAAFKLEGEYR
jgi:CHAT domain-containing protein